jgi:hypothetical protein
MIEPPTRSGRNSTANRRRKSSPSVRGRSEQLATDFCTEGRKPHGGWVEFNFPKAGGTQPERKVTYFLAAQGTPYVAAAGVYDATAKVEDLEKVSGRQP